MPTAGAISDYLEGALLNHVLRNTALPSPTTVYVALFSDVPTDAGGTELSGNGYARQAATFSAPSGGSCANAIPITFTASGGDWGTVQGVGIFDASTAGNLLFRGALEAPKMVNAGDSLQFPVGQLQVSLD